MLKQRVEYRLNFNVYYSDDSMWSTHATALTETELLEQKNEFIEKQKNADGKLSVELITISGIIKTTIEFHPEQTETIQLVDLVTNSHAPLNIQGFKK